MNLNFKVLWFEDDHNWYDAEILSIEKIINDKYILTLSPDFYPDKTNISTLSINNYDLILVDYNLADGAKGTYIIDEIRKNTIYTDIVFYSANYDEMVSSVLKGKTLLSGVYYINRINFDYEVPRIIEKIVRRTETVENLRGILTDNVSYFDKIITEMIIRLNQQQSIIMQKNDLKKYLADMFNESSNDYKERTHKIISAPCPITNVCDAKNYIFDSEKRGRLFQKMCNYHNSELLNKNFIQEYKDDILYYRNNLSHQNIKMGDKLPNQEIIDSKLFIKLRDNLVKFKMKLEKVKCIIS